MAGRDRVIAHRPFDDLAAAGVLKQNARCATAIVGADADDVIARDQRIESAGI
jgi:hypothetical protein